MSSAKPRQFFPDLNMLTQSNLLFYTVQFIVLRPSTPQK